MSMNYQWYPGHMTKARRQMQEDVKLIDLIIELVDARIPVSSANPDLNEIGQNKFRLVLMNKSDLADPSMNKKWMDYYQSKGIKAIEINALNRATLKNINSIVMDICQQKIERDRKRGIINRPLRAMVVGIPNVGKSTFINSFAGKASAKTGNKPGVTKGKQWIRLNKSIELLDTPGILWPKFESEQVGERLALIGSINDDIINTEELAMTLIKYLRVKYSGALMDRFKLESEEGDELHILESMAKTRGCLKSGGNYDIAKISSIVLDEFRSGKLGRISLDDPKELQ